VPTKGFFTQTLAILLKNPASVDEMEALLQGFRIIRRVEAAHIWSMAGAGVQLSYRPEVNGCVVVDLIDRPWPDHMGHPQDDPEVFVSWATGNFGPGAWAGALERACQHSWGWPDGRTVPKQHQAFVRVRSSYVFGLGDGPIIPDDYDAVHEISFLTAVVAELLRLPQALCYFNPNGECVKEPGRFWSLLDDHARAGRLPLDVWSNVRFFRIDGASPMWSLMDTVGMGQLDASDHEACFQFDAYEPGEVDNFLRNLSAYVVENGPVIESGDTIDGPGDVAWRAFVVGQSDLQPPRDIIRWFPVDGRETPEELLKPIEG
jgi:hypothetical protein